VFWDFFVFMNFCFRTPIFFSSRCLDGLCAELAGAEPPLGLDAGQRVRAALESVAGSPQTLKAWLPRRSGGALNGLAASFKRLFL